MTLRIQDGPDGARLSVKAVPGSSRDAIAGILGDALKVCVTAPPEHGKANDRICDTIAKALSVPRRDVAVVAGLSSKQKTVLVRGLGAAEVLKRIDAAIGKG